MEKCSCWKTKSVVTKWRNDTPIDVETVQYCNGTKEQEVCSCRGDVSKCDFYPEKRGEKKSMNTAEMYLQAKKDGKYYKTSFIAYQKDKGLFDDCFNNYGDLSAWDFDDFMELNWEVWENIMTKSEAEAKFNIKIVGD